MAQASDIQMTLSQPEQKVVTLFRALVDDFRRTGEFSLGTVTTSYGRVNVSLFSGDPSVPERENQVPTEDPASMQDILDALQHLQETRARADRVEKENRRRIVTILAQLLKNHPCKDDIMNILSL